MQDYSFTSGVVVTLHDDYLEIIRTDKKSARKSLFLGRTMGTLVMIRKSISGVIFYADWMLICASGFPSPSDFKLSRIADIKQYPNCVVANENEIEEFYNRIFSKWLFPSI